MASTSSSTPFTEKRPQEEDFLTRKNKKRKLEKALEETDTLIRKDLSVKKNLPQAFCDVLELLLDKIDDRKKVDVMIKLMNVVQDELNKQNS